MEGKGEKEEEGAKEDNEGRGGGDEGMAQPDIVLQRKFEDNQGTGSMEWSLLLDLFRRTPLHCKFNQPWPGISRMCN